MYSFEIEVKDEEIAHLLRLQAFLSEHNESFSFEQLLVQRL